MMLSTTSRPTLIFPVEDPRVDPPREKCSHPRRRPSKFSKGAAARRSALCAWRCAHRTPSRVDRPGSNRQNPNPPIFWIYPLHPLITHQNVIHTIFPTLCPWCPVRGAKCVRRVREDSQLTT